MKNKKYLILILIPIIFIFSSRFFEVAPLIDEYSESNAKSFIANRFVNIETKQISPNTKLNVYVDKYTDIVYFTRTQQVEYGYRALANGMMTVIYNKDGKPMTKTEYLKQKAEFEKIVDKIYK